MICKSCNAVLPEDSCFCPNCGARREEQMRPMSPQAGLDDEKTMSMKNSSEFGQQKPVYGNQFGARTERSQEGYAGMSQGASYESMPNAKMNYGGQQYAPNANMNYGGQQYAPNPNYSTQSATHNGKVSFGQAVKLFFSNYMNFSGRASKSEYWWGFLFTCLMAMTIIGGVVCYIGQLSLTIRRLHDIGKPWTWLFMGLIPYAGVIILIVYYCKDSVGDNQWGAGPIQTGYGYNQNQYS